MLFERSYEKGGDFLKIDLGTFALILILSNIIQAIFIYFQAAINKKYQGLKEYALGSIFLSLGFLFIFLQSIAQHAFIINITGNSLIILAAMFQYIGLMRFIGRKVNLRFICLLLAISVSFLTYFSIYNNITLRVVDVASAISLIFFMTARGLLRKGKSLIVFQTRVLGSIYLVFALLSLIRAITAIFSEPLYTSFTPVIMQVLSYATVFTITLFTTFGFIYIINLRLISEISESKEHFEQIFNLSPDAALITTFSDGRIVNFNQGFIGYFGYTHDELIGKSLYDLNIYEDINSLQDTLRILNEKGLIKNTEKRFICKDNRRIICIVSYEKIIINGTPHIISFAHDITERKANEDGLKESEEKYRFLTEFASDVTWVYDLTNKKYEYVSPSVFELRGITAEEAVRERFEDSFTPETFPILKDLIVKNMKVIPSNHISNEYFIAEVQQPCNNGVNIWAEISIKFNISDLGNIEIFGVSRNIEKRKKFEKQVIYLSYHDQLTGLFNRRFYEEEIKRIDKPENLPIALVMIDVNGLKLINDAFGHVTGDILLEKVSNVFKSECRENETVARIGGDEFIVFLQKTSSEAAKRFIERIQTSVSRENIYDITLSLSLGYAIKQESNDDISKILNKAENDMYRNKLSEKSTLRNTSIVAILNLVYKKSSFEKLHSKRVEALCENIATKLNWDKEAVAEIKAAGLMHDIGKIGVDDSIINKPSRLTDFEFSEIKRHSETGFRILSSSNEFDKIAEYVLEHHERWDGKGYPRGLKGEEISIQARIITIADSYDVMKSERAYCNNMSENEAVIEIKKCAGTQFDPKLSRFFIENILEKTW